MEMILELVVGVIDMEVDKVADETTNEVADMEVYKEGKIFKNVKIVKKKSDKEWRLITFHLWRCFLIVFIPYLQSGPAGRHNSAKIASETLMKIIFLLLILNLQQNRQHCCRF